MKDLAFLRWWELGDKVGGGAAAGPSPGNTEFSNSCDTVVQRRWRLRGVYSHMRYLCFSQLAPLNACGISLMQHCHSLSKNNNTFAQVYIKQMFVKFPKNITRHPISLILQHHWKSCGGRTTPDIWWRLSKTQGRLTLIGAKCLILELKSHCSARFLLGTALKWKAKELLLHINSQAIEAVKLIKSEWVINQILKKSSLPHVPLNIWVAVRSWKVAVIPFMVLLTKI